MGASGWRYEVAWEPDVAAALQRLRQDVFASGGYYREDPDGGYLDEMLGGGGRSRMSEAEFEATLDPDDEDRGINDALREVWRQAQGGANHAPPSTPEELLAAQPHSGTHSIIDIARGVSPTPAWSTASPLTAEQLTAAFGTLTPSTPQVRSWLEGYPEGGLRDRWQALYVISYGPDGTPHRLHFAGFSGD